MTVVLITDDDHVYTANVGDSHAVLVDLNKGPKDDS
jgi:serine/threonine protein phosphatase PrpC